MTTVTDNEALKKAVFAILSQLEAPEEATYRQIRDSLATEHEIQLQPEQKELVLRAIDEFFAEAEPDADVDADTDVDASGGNEAAGNHAESDAEKNVPIKAARKAGGFTAPVVLSYELSIFLGEKILPRTQVTKKIWEYIREKNLQNPANRREILCDEKLETVLKRKKLTMFQMTKVLSGMMKSAKQLQASCLFDDEEEDQDSKAKKDMGKSKSSGSKKRGRGDEETENDNEEKVKPKAKKIKKEISKKAAATSKNGKLVVANESKKSTKTKANSGSAINTAKVYINPELVELLGMGEDDFKRTKVVSKMWEYIKAHNLQNPKDRREILLDAPLKKILGVQKCTMFSINKHLSPHIKAVEDNTT